MLVLFSYFSCVLRHLIRKIEKFSISSKHSSKIENVYYFLALYDTVAHFSSFGGSWRRPESLVNSLRKVISLSPNHDV